MLRSTHLIGELAAGRLQQQQSDNRAECTAAECCVRLVISVRGMHLSPLSTVAQLGRRHTCFNQASTGQSAACPKPLTLTKFGRLAALTVTTFVLQAHACRAITDGVFESSDDRERSRNKVNTITIQKKLR